jgi:hypothetical protein
MEAFSYSQQHEPVCNVSGSIHRAVSVTVNLSGYSVGYRGNEPRPRHTAYMAGTVGVNVL